MCFRAGLTAVQIDMTVEKAGAEGAVRAAQCFLPATVEHGRMGARCRAGAWDLSPSTPPSFSPCSIASVTGEAMSEGREPVKWAKHYTGQSVDPLGWWAQGARGSLWACNQRALEDFALGMVPWLLGSGQGSVSRAPTLSGELSWAPGLQPYSSELTGLGKCGSLLWS